LSFAPPQPPRSPRRGNFSCAPANDPGVCTFLGDFYYATHGNLWASSWWKQAASGIPTDYCHYYTCSAKGEINQLSISGISPSLFIGTLPDSIGMCTSLQTLRLSSLTGLSGSLPPSLGSLTNLVSLDLSLTSLSGSVPSSWSSLTSLQYLILTTFLQSIPPQT